MASLADTAAELSREVSGDDPQERAANLARLIREEHPGRWKVRSVQTAAARAVGAETPAELERRADPPRRGRRSRRRRKVPRVKVAPAQTFGSLFAQMLGLVLLYWVIRSAGAVGQILDNIGSAVRWFVDPVGWGSQSPTNR